MSHGVVPANGKLDLCVRFQPQTVGEHSTDYFTIVSAGCLLQTVLKVVGSCKGTRVKAFPVSPCLLLSTVREGLETVTVLSHRLTFCWDPGCLWCTVWGLYVFETDVRLLEVNVQLFAGTGGFADEVILFWEDQLSAAVACDTLTETPMIHPGSVLHVVVLGPLVSLHQCSVDFNWINLGESSMQTLKISNTSDVPAYYQFDIDGRGSIFSFDRPCGVLEGTTTLALKVTFRPTHPISYHRRVVCLVHHQV